MSITRFEIERFSLISSRPFETVVSALKANVGRLDLVAFANASKRTGTFAELESVIGRNPGKTGLMLFIELDDGAVLRKVTGLDTPKIVRLVIGNPLVMKEMAKHVPDAGSYLPLQFLWTNVPTACICHMTRWRVSWLPMEMRTPSPSLAT